MTTFLQWTSILATGAVLVAYGFFRDNIELKKARQQAEKRRNLEPERILTAAN